MFALLFAFFLLAIIVSFLCSLWEAVLLSITPSYAQIKLKEGSRVGKRLQAFKENIDRPLAAILTLNTIAHTVGAVGVGNQAAKIWAEANPLITSLVVPAGMTLAILVLSELIPKTLGANFWRELTAFTAKSLSVVITLLFPLVWFSQFITLALKRDKSKSVFSRMDFLALAEVGTEQGVFEPYESAIITNLLQFNSIRSEDVMTPRVVVKAAPREQTIGQFYHANRDERFSRIPLYVEGSMDKITGYILKDEMLAAVAENRGDEPVHVLERKIMTVSESFPIPDLFNRFLQEREHIALVVGEFGGMSGIVTMEDVIETLLGLEIVDESDSIEDMQAQARKNWEKRAGRIGLIKSS
ncbi:MAG: hemolysin family protein [Desulfobacteraceae bacterium]|nr:hemolysin family protein [Desulfobacteraceae bacterium]